MRLVFPNGRGKPLSLANIWNRGLIRLQEAADVVDEEGRAKYNMRAARLAAGELAVIG